MKWEMKINPDLMIFVMQKDLIIKKKKVGTCKLTIVGYKNAYLFVKVFKIHEKESKNDKYSHEIWHTAIDQIKLEYEIY